MLAIVDLETTGLDHTLDEILEIAIIVIDDDLAEVATMQPIQIRPSVAASLRMDQFVQTMHRQSGLTEAIRIHGETLTEAIKTTTAFVNDWLPSGSLLVGNSVHFDRRFLRQYMPWVEAHFHYRNGDISSVREFAQRWTPRLTEIEPHAQGKHRALSDCRDSLNLLRFYKEHLFERSR